MHTPIFLMTSLAALVLPSSGTPRNVVPWVGGYEFIAGPLNWTAAESACAASGGRLALPQTAAEGAALQQLLSEQDVAQAHIGFHDLFLENEYVTVLGQSLSQVGYQQGSLVADDEADCGSLANDGYRSVQCDTELPAICQRQAGADYDLVEGFGYYKLSSEQALWVDAVRTCREEGTDLLVLRSYDEYTALIVKYLNMTTGYWVHYGAHHAFEDQRFLSLFGEPLEETGFLLWHSNEPSASNVDRPYLALTIPEKGRDRGLALMDDQFSRRFICKRPLSPY